MKILTGVLLALVVALGLTGWRLSVVNGDLAGQKARNAGLLADIERQEQANRVLDGRLTLLDQSLTRLHETTAAQSRQLGLTLAGIDRIEKSEGDSHEAISCLDVRVPSELDRWLR